MWAIATWLDGNWIDIGSMMCAVLAATVRLVRHCLGERDGTPLHDRMITDALNGAALLPFFALILTVFSTSIIKDIEHASKVTFGLAGLVGVIWMVNELRK